jgi:hypothetical protein
MVTTVSISVSLKSRIDAFKKMWSFKTYEDTLAAMLNYFEQVGDDPTNPQFTAKAQMAEMNRRLDQVVRFQRKFETEKLQPVLEEMRKQSRHMLNVLPQGGVATKSDVAELLEQVQDLPTHEEMREAILRLYDVLNSQNPKTGAKNN